MFKIVFILFFVGGLVSCTQGQRFDLLKNAQLDECAMKRISETKISGQTGYLQSLQECHQIVLIQKAYALHLSDIGEVSKPRSQDHFKSYSGNCWGSIKDMVLDKYYPYLKLPDKTRESSRRAAVEKQDEIVTANLRKYALPEKLTNLDNEKLLMVRDVMRGGYLLGRDSLCSSEDFHELESIVGMEIHRRYPYGVN